jgi:hypothetical protein
MNMNMLNFHESYPWGALTLGPFFLLDLLPMHTNGWPITDLYMNHDIDLWYLRHYSCSPYHHHRYGWLLLLHVQRLRPRGQRDLRLELASHPSFRVRSDTL